MNSRELVLRTLEFEQPRRVPRQLWVLPWAQMNHSEALVKIKADFPDDITGVGGFQEEWPETLGDPYEIGTYVDEWGCKFTNRQGGVIGEVKDPLIQDLEWADIDKLVLPEALLKIQGDKVNDFCRSSSKFVIAGACPRPFERLQFIRGTEQLYIDLMLRPAGLFEALRKIHDYYCRELEVWAQTEVDALTFMDDWGSQNSLLIHPKLWVELFKPLYKDYIDIAHQHGKKIFMHSDGYTLDIIPHLIELGLDALNAQIFCIGIEKLKPYRGKLTFWGEIDRQHLLPNGTLEDIDAAVGCVKDTLWQNGGCIAQCEFGPGGNPDNVYRAFETWDQML